MASNYAITRPFGGVDTFYFDGFAYRYTLQISDSFLNGSALGYGRTYHTYFAGSSSHQKQDISTSRRLSYLRRTENAQRESVQTAKKAVFVAGSELRGKLASESVRKVALKEFSEAKAKLVTAVTKRANLLAFEVVTEKLSNQSEYRLTNIVRGEMVGTAVETQYAQDEKQVNYLRSSDIAEIMLLPTLNDYEQLSEALTISGEDSITASFNDDETSYPEDLPNKGSIAYFETGKTQEGY